MNRVLCSFILLSAVVAGQLSLTLVGSFNSPFVLPQTHMGACVDSATGEIWVVNSYPQLLERYSPAGVLLSTHPIGSCTPAMPTPSDITQDRSTGDLWLVDPSMRTMRFSTSGSCLGGGFPIQLFDALAIAHSPVSGTLFIGGAGAVTGFTRAGQVVPGGFTTLGVHNGLTSGLTYVPSSGRFLLSTPGTAGLFEVTTLGGPPFSFTSLAAFGVSSNIHGVDYDPLTGRIVIADVDSAAIWIFQDNFVGGAQYQVDQHNARLNINNVWGTPSTLATVTLGVNQTGTLTAISYLHGALWEMCIGTAPPLSRSQGAIDVGDGQLLNIDIADPALTLWCGGFQGPPWSSFVVPFSFPLPVAFSLQLVMADPSMQSGLRISQPVRLVVQ